MKHLVDKVDALIDEMRSQSAEQIALRANAADVERDLARLRTVTLQRLADLIETMGEHVSRQQAVKIIPLIGAMISVRQLIS